MRAVGISLVSLVPLLASAEGLDAVGGHKSVYNDVEEKGPWSEEAVQPPAFPRPENLIEFYVSSATTNHFFIDGSSLSVGKDGVVHYVLVVETSGGARNVSFEGIHCATREYKIYATGRADGSWLPTRGPIWRTIENKAVNRYHAELNRNLFCPIGNPINSPEEGRDALRRGKHPMVP